MWSVLCYFAVDTKVDPVASKWYSCDRGRLQSTDSGTAVECVVLHSVEAPCGV